MATPHLRTGRPPSPGLGRLVPAVVLLVALGSVAGVLLPPAAAQGPSERALAHPAVAQVVSIYQTPSRITQQDKMNVYLELASSTGIEQIYYTFCQLTSSICYTPPVVMQPIGGNWYEGSTKPMTGYSGMTPGIRAGYNITIEYTSGANLTEPSIPNAFSNLTVAQSITGEYLYQMSVSNLTYVLSGQVLNQTSGQPIDGANVTISPGNGTTSVTNTAGDYSFAGVGNGTYTISVSAAGYHPQAITVAVDGSSVSKQVELTSTASKVTTPAKTSSAPSFWGSTEGYLVLVAVAVIVVLVAALEVRALRRRRPPNTSPTEASKNPETPPQQP